MNPLIQAVFDSGVFRPLGPVDLAEGTQVEVRAPTPAPPQADGTSANATDNKLQSSPSASWPVFPTKPGGNPITAEMVQQALDGDIPEHLA